MEILHFIFNPIKTHFDSVHSDYIYQTLKLEVWFIRRMMIVSCMAREENKFRRFRFNKLAIQTTARMAADKEAVGLSRVHMKVLEWQTHRCFPKTISNRKLLFF